MTSTGTSPEGDDGSTYDGYGTDSVDQDDQLTVADTLGDGSGSDTAGEVVDELDRGYSPPEKYSPGQGFGNTPYEEEIGESLDQRIAQEVPEPDPYLQAEAETDTEANETLDDGEVGGVRAGRLVDPDQGLGEDTEKDLVGDDVGIDGAAASAEEAAMHIVEDVDTDAV